LGKVAPPYSSHAVLWKFCYAVSMAEDHAFVTVQGRGLIAIPTAIRRHFGLDQPGAQVEVIEREGEIVLRPHVAVPVDQAWFWTERWQQMEREADAAVAAGRVMTVEGVEELLADLDS
jgi:antitoxin MazE